MNKLKIALLALLMGSPISVMAQKDADVKAIKDLCGCYEVTFEYAETFSPNKDYQVKPTKAQRGLEWITVAEEGKNALALQHLLIVGDSMIVKHWRQDWSYEDPYRFTFLQDKTWQRVETTGKAVKGQWTQKVYEVDDSPRYAGSATWVHVDGKRYWENTADAPLPRREYTTRNDYNVMRRNNRHELTSYGHVHEQDNEKVVRSESGEQLIAKEKGLNTYRKVDDRKCALAADWWKQHAPFWSQVRLAWKEVILAYPILQLQTKVDGKFLYEALDTLEKKQAGQAEIAAVLRQYIRL